MVIIVTPLQSEWQELNLRSLGPKPSERPLSHTPICLTHFSMLWPVFAIYEKEVVPKQSEAERVRVELTYT